MSLTHTRTLQPTRLKWRAWNWAGTWKEYSKQLSFSPASSDPFRMNIFTSATLLLPFFPLSFLLPLLLCLLLFNFTFAPPSPCPIPLQVGVSLPRGHHTECDNTAIMPRTCGRQQTYRPLWRYRCIQLVCFIRQNSVFSCFCGLKNAAKVKKNIFKGCCFFCSVFWKCKK